VSDVHSKATGLTGYGIDKVALELDLREPSALAEGFVNWPAPVFKT
jgi:hypothetical protein